jgi:hypothetical protein
VVESCLQLYQEMPTALMGEVSHIKRKPAAPLDALPQKPAKAAPALSCVWPRSWVHMLDNHPNFFLHVFAATTIGGSIFYMARHI